MNPIIKATRRQRYIAFIVRAKDTLKEMDDTEFIREIRIKCQRVLQKDWKEVGLWLIIFNGTEGIIRCHAKEKEHTMLLLRSLDRIGTVNVEVTPVKTSGTLKGLHRHLIPQQKLSPSEKLL